VGADEAAKMQESVAVSDAPAVCRSRELRNLADVAVAIADQEFQHTGAEKTAALGVKGSMANDVLALGLGVTRGSWSASGSIRPGSRCCSRSKPSVAPVPVPGVRHRVQGS
jgi:hypothetical protein